MPSSNRWRIKQQLDQALHLLDKSQDYIAVTAKPFEGVHDDYFQAFVKLMIAIEAVKHSLQELRDMV